jgi:hypothetical protein
MDRLGIAKVALVTVLTAVWGFLLESEPVLFFKLFDEL